jgi:dTDP-4-dehydrorhamnose 3,5-epimerase
MAFTFQQTELEGAQLVATTPHSDDRGVLREGYVQSAFREAGITTALVQQNIVRSGRHVLRGLHYQLPPRAQAKLVSVAAGRIFDVGVDLRAGSSTFGRWTGAELTADNGQMLYLPAGFAHGFVVLSEAATVVYLCSAEYAPGRERGIRWDDPRVAIEWPVDRPVLSERDRELPGLDDAELP